MDHFRKLRQQIILRLSLLFLIIIGLTLASSWALSSLEVTTGLAIGGGLLAAVVLSLCLALITSSYFLQPVQVLWQAVLHVSSTHQAVTPPELDKLRLGRELLTSLVTHVYELARHETPQASSTKAVPAADLINLLPLPVLVCSKDQTVLQASSAAAEYYNQPKLVGRPLFESVQLEFPSGQTLEDWMQAAQASKVTDRAYWERVRVHDPANPKGFKQCDLAAYYNRDNPTGTEFIIAVFDRSRTYTQDDEALSFIALAVHELRTPLTTLRGYIEVLEEELGGQLNPEMNDFLNKLKVSSEQLTGFVNNILNVARVEDNQLVLQLAEADWAEALRQAVADNTLHARVHGKLITLNIAKNLPPVAIDKVSIYEVVSNLLDNAVKYSAESQEIIVSASLAPDGTVVTTVQDFGVGIPANVLPNLFEKFYRNHRTRRQVGGTGLGLYLSKAIVNAHGGQIWAQSKEGECTTLGFSLIPYAHLAEEQKAGNNTEITRAAHGWVKNHSFYRR